MLWAAPMSAPIARLSLIALAAIVAACSAGDLESPPAPSPLGGDSALLEVFAEASAATGVPAEVIATVSYTETRLRFVGGEGDPHHGETDGHGGERIGLMALSVGGVRDTGRAAQLAGLSESALFLDARANVTAGAALLAHLAEGTPRDLADWAPALRAYGGGGAGGQRFADEVLERMRLGWRGTDEHGVFVVCSARSIAAPAEDGFGKLSLAVGYPDSIWNPAYGGNYRNANRGAAQINYIIIHTVQGSYGSAISWFKDPRAKVSAHYVVRSSDGEVTQMVGDEDVAWHDACFNDNTIGIEHEGYVQDPGTWYTETMYMSSAKITAWLAEQYGIPVDRAHIMGHGEAPDCSTHTDPGSGWNWDHYMHLVKNAGKPNLDARLAGADFPARLRSGEKATVYFEFENLGDITWGIDETRLGTQMPQDRASSFFRDGQWLSPNRATGADTANFAPGGVGRFSFEIEAPAVDAPTVFVEHFQLVQEGEAWFGPIVSMSLEVVPAGSDPDDVLPDTSSQDLDLDSEQDLAGGCSAANGSGVSSGGFALLLLGAAWIGRRRPGRRERGLR